MFFAEYVEDLLDDIEDETTGSFQRILSTLANVRFIFTLLNCLKFASNMIETKQSISLKISCSYSGILMTLQKVVSLLTNACPHIRCATIQIN